MTGLTILRTPRQSKKPVSEGKKERRRKKSHATASQTSKKKSSSKEQRGPHGHSYPSDPQIWFKMRYTKPPDLNASNPPHCSHVKIQAFIPSSFAGYPSIPSSLFVTLNLTPSKRSRPTARLCTQTPSCGRPIPGLKRAIR